MLNRPTHHIVQLLFLSSFFDTVIYPRLSTTAFRYFSASFFVSFPAAFIKSLIHFFFLRLVEHFHLRRANAFLVGLPLGFFIGPLTPFIRAQKDRLRGPPPGCGAFRLDPVALLYFARPAAVRPPERDL